MVSFSATNATRRIPLCAMWFIALCLIAVWSYCDAPVAAADAPGDTPPAPDYTKQIAPIFRKYCNGCHNAEDAEGRLVLDSYESLLKGGGRGVSISAGHSDRSRLVLVLDGGAKPAMPPEGSAGPKPEEIALLKTWVDAGAKGPSGAAPDPTQLITPMVKLLAKPRVAVTAAAWSPDGRLIALGGYRRVRLIDAASRDPVRELNDVRGNVNHLAFSADGKKLLTAAGEPGLFGEAILWDVASGSPLKTFTGHTDSLYAAVLSPNGNLLATGGYDQKIQLWDVAGGKPLRTIKGHYGAVFDLAFGPGGRILASASADRTVKLWEVATGKRLDTLGQSLKELYSLAISPDGRFVAAAGVDNRIRLWRLSPTAREGTNPLIVSRYAHQKAILKLVWSADGKTLASASEDGSLKLWDAAKVTQRRLLPPQPDWTPALAFAPDGKKLAVGRLDGSFVVYDASTAKEIPAPRPELARAEPRGVQIGASTRIRLVGKHLSRIEKVTFSDKRITGRVLAEGHGKSGEAWIEVAAATAVPSNAFEVTVTTHAGKSGVLKLHAGMLPQVSEHEPNEKAQTATALSLPASCWGVIARRGDADHFCFEGKAGQTIVFDVAAARLGSKLNAMLTVLDPSGNVVQSNNDFDQQADPLLAYTLSRDGRHTVRVADLTLGSSADHFYRLSIGAFPYVTGCYPLAVPAGRETSVTLAGYNLPIDIAVKVRSGASGEVAVPLPPGFLSRRGLKVRVSTMAEVLETEPNDLPKQATAMSAPGGASGLIWSRGSQGEDSDLFRFRSKVGQTWIVGTEAAVWGSPADTKIEVLDAAGGPLQRLLLQAMRDSYISFRSINSTTNDARVHNWREMELNEFLYMQGEVCKLFRLPQGPDSGFRFYEINGKRRCYFDTSPTGHALDEACYIVQPHPVGTQIVPNGLPTFPLYYANDDDADRRLGSDSKLSFTAPRDGDYLVRVSDVRGHGGDRFAYHLVVREAQPDFTVAVGGKNASVNSGSGKQVTFTATRSDGFEEAIDIEASGLPPGVSLSSPIRIQAGHNVARAILHLQPDAPAWSKDAWSKVKLTAKAKIGEKPITKPLGNLGQVKRAPSPKLTVHLEPAEVTIEPGATVSATLKVERNGFDGRIRFEVNNLPHGVIVDNIGLSGVLIPAGETQRRIFLTARDWVAETTRPFHAVAGAEGNQASAPILLHVRKPGGGR